MCLYRSEQCHMYQRNTKSHTDKANMKDNANNTMIGCISTESRQMNITKNRRNSTSNIKTNKRTL